MIVAALRAVARFSAAIGGDGLLFVLDKELAHATCKSIAMIHSVEELLVILANFPPSFVVVLKTAPTDSMWTLVWEALQANSHVPSLWLDTTTTSKTTLNVLARHFHLHTPEDLPLDVQQFIVRPLQSPLHVWGPTVAAEVMQFNDDVASVPLQLALVVLRLTQFDPQVFLRYLPVLTKKLPRLTTARHFLSLMTELQQVQLWSPTDPAIAAFFNQMPTLHQPTSTNAMLFRSGPPKAIVPATLSTLSKSRVWATQQAFYKAQGMAAWSSNTVPYGVSSSMFLAAAYARVVVRFFIDCYRQHLLSPTDTVNCVVLEGGSGSCKFAAAFIPAVMALLEDADLQHVIRPCVIQDDPIRLRVANATLDVSTTPLFVVGNYFFDSLPTDAFVVDGDGAVCEVCTDGESADTFTLSHDVADTSQYYQDNDDSKWLNQALTALVQHIQAAYPRRKCLLLFPVDAFRFVLALRRRSSANSPFGMLVGDATVHFSDILTDIPELSPHADCFCLPVDFDVINWFLDIAFASTCKVQVSTTTPVFSDTFQVLYATLFPLQEASSTLGATDKARLLFQSCLHHKPRAKFATRLTTAMMTITTTYYLLKLADSGGWHYVVMVVLFADFFTNAVAVAFLSVTTYVKYASLCRLVSLGCSGVYALDMLVRLVGIRTALFRSPATLMDFVGCGCMGGMLALRYIKADNLAAVIITRVGYYDEKAGAGNQKFPKFGSNQVEIYFASGYCVLVSARIAFKPVARAFSKTLYEQPSFDLLRFSMASLRATLRRIPSITEAAVDLMEHDLSVTCGRTDGDLSRAELMQFLEKAVVHRPRHMSASAFLSHLRDIDAQSSRFVYGALDVVTSTLRHWSNQRVALFCTVLVVLANASFVPVVAYFISLLGDEAFPQQAGHVAINDAVKGLYLRSQVRYKNVTTDPYTGSDTALPYITPEWSLHAGVVGIVVVCVPFAIVDFLMGYFQSTMIAKATERLQASLLKTILAQPTLFFSQRTEGDLNNLFQSDVARVNALWQANLMHPIVSIMSGFSFLIYFEPSVGMVCLGFAAMIVSSGPQGYASKKSKDFGSKNAYVSAEFQNAIACQKVVVRAYSIQDKLLAKFDKTTQTLKQSQFLKDFWAGVVQIYVDSAMFFFVAVMTAALATKVYRADITAGDFFSAVTLMSRISTPVTVLGGFMRVAIGNASSLQRLDEIVREV
ncbi:hypothetical protein DYB25_007977 [Aphanomyces astaci]|uniref:ABC transmembrane type-1 domain-containing protein n=1 Tax=Aphanomyces astaci TaxID=112090 RepID=A0A397BSU3_APHAT|nr:hypothetical protein DYB25_007977 [Aphanomyces astaci]